MIDVLVIGGGLAGCATAFFLAVDGVGVTVIERSDLNTQASGSNAGSLHLQIPHDPFVRNGDAWAAAFAPTIPLLAHSIAIWRGLPALLGVDLEVVLGGGILVAATDAEMRDIVRKAEIERAQGLRIELLDRADVRARAPYLSETLLGGAFCPDEGKANPLAAAPAFAAAAVRHGARIVRHCTVTGIARQSDGFLVETDQGLFHARRVVNAAGASAGRVAHLLGIDITSIEAHPIQVSVTEPAAPFVPHLVYSAGQKLTLKQNRVGSLLIGGGWEARIGRHGNLVTDQNSLARNLAIAVATVPQLGPLRIIRTWAAFVNGTADWKPILGEVPGEPGFFVNFVPWMGFTAGPVAARITASLVQNRVPPLDIDLRAFLLH